MSRETEHFYRIRKPAAKIRVKLDERPGGEEPGPASELGGEGGGDRKPKNFLHVHNNHDGQRHARVLLCQGKEKKEILPGSSPANEERTQGKNCYRAKQRGKIKERVYQRGERQQAEG